MNTSAWLGRALRGCIREGCLQNVNKRIDRSAVSISQTVVGYVGQGYKSMDVHVEKETERNKGRKMYVVINRKLAVLPFFRHKTKLIYIRSESAVCLNIT